MRPFDFSKFPIRLVELSAFDRVRPTAAGLRSLVNDLRSFGQAEPLITYRKPNGKLGIVRGFRRFAAMRLADKRRWKFQAGPLAGKRMDAIFIRIVSKRVAVRLDTV